LRRSERAARQAAGSPRLTAGFAGANLRVPRSNRGGRTNFQRRRSLRDRR